MSRLGLLHDSLAPEALPQNGQMLLIGFLQLQPTHFYVQIGNLFIYCINSYIKSIFS